MLLLGGALFQAQARATGQPVLVCFGDSITPVTG